VSNSLPGQQIRLAIVADETRRSTRNPFDTAVMPGRPLAERVTMPRGRSDSRSASPSKRYEEDAARKGIDRYVPSSTTRSRSQSPPPRRRGGRRPGARREQVPRDGNGGRGGSARAGRDGRPKKTQEELDAEMASYFGGAEAGAANGDGEAAADDVDMIE
jgi:THO complex subunit 4